MTVAGRLCVLPSVAARVREVQALCRLGRGLPTVGVTHAAGCPSAMLRVRVAAARFRWTWAPVSGFRDHGASATSQRLPPSTGRHRCDALLATSYTLMAPRTSGGRTGVAAVHLA
jgi:hypothetical protein